MKRVTIRGLGFLLVAVPALVLFGCLIPSREALKDPGPRSVGGQTERSEIEKAHKEHRLIKPVIPPGKTESGEDRAIDPPPALPPAISGAAESVPTTSHGSAQAPSTEQPQPPPAVSDMDAPPPAVPEQAPSAAPSKPEHVPATPTDSSIGKPTGSDTSASGNALEKTPVPRPETASTDKKDKNKEMKPIPTTSPDSTRNSFGSCR